MQPARRSLLHPTTAQCTHYILTRSDLICNGCRHWSCALLCATSLRSSTEYVSAVSVKRCVTQLRHCLVTHTGPRLTSPGSPNRMKTRHDTARNASVSIAMQKVHHNQTGKFPATDVRQRSRGVDSIIGTSEISRLMTESRVGGIESHQIAARSHGCRRGRRRQLRARLHTWWNQ